MRASCCERAAGTPIKAGQNTTIGVVATNARLTKAQATKVAQMAHDGLARAIYPAHTMGDGDAIFALATGAIENSDVSRIGALAADAMAEAIVRAVQRGRRAFPDIPQQGTFSDNDKRMNDTERSEVPRVRSDDGEASPHCGDSR